MKFIKFFNTIITLIQNSDISCNVINEFLNCLSDYEKRVYISEISNIRELISLKNNL